MKASRYWDQRHPVFYVAQLPGQGGVDWGYTSRCTEAIELTPYWQRRFAADCRRVGVEANFHQNL